MFLVGTFIFQRQHKAMATSNHGEYLTSQSTPKRLMIRWTALKGIIAIIVFLIIAALAEYLVVVYAISQGITDTTLLQLSFEFPGTSWPVTIAVSPMFHLVPIAVIITLAFSWTYLTRKMAVKQAMKTRPEPSPRRQKQHGDARSKVTRSLRRFFRKIKSVLLKARGIAYVWQKVHFARATLRSAFAVLSLFLVFTFIFILFTHPQLIYRAVSGAYENNSPLYSFVTSISNSARGFAEAVSPIGWIASGINSALIGASPTIKSMGIALGNMIKPFADLDNSGKYLVFQNAAAWISVFIVLFHGEYRMKRIRYKK